MSFLTCTILASALTLSTPVAADPLPALNELRHVFGELVKQDLLNKNADCAECDFALTPYFENSDNPSIPTLTAAVSTDGLDMYFASYDNCAISTVISSNAYGMQFISDLSTGDIINVSNNWSFDYDEINDVSTMTHFYSDGIIVTLFNGDQGTVVDEQSVLIDD